MSDDAEARDDIAEAFMRVCEALGIQASPLAYLEVPAIIRSAASRSSIPAAAALPRAAGWAVEEPKCGCSTYRCCRDHVPD